MLIRLVPFLLFICGSAAAQVRSDNPLQTPLDRLADSLVQAAFQRGDCTGLALGVVRNGETHVYHYGETVKGNGTLPDDRTVFEIGSISKTFTAALLALQVNSGAVGLHDELGKYLPDSVPAPAFGGTPVTLAMLSNHSSGLPRMPLNFVSRQYHSSNPYASYTVDLLFSFLKNYALTRQPGTVYEYSNLAAGLLGVLLARFSHSTYERLLEQHITRPLQMNDTRVTCTASMKKRLAQGYNQQGAAQGPWNFPALAGAGGIRSTLHDLLLYARANMGVAPAALKAALALTHQETFRHGGQTVGLGWHLLTLPKGRFVTHNGQTGGYYSFLAVDPAAGTAVIALSNVSKANNIGGPLLRGL